MTTVSSTKTPPVPLRLSERDEQIIWAVGVYKNMLVDDVFQLLNSGSLSTYREHMRRLAGGKDYATRGYLFRAPLLSETKGTKPRVYCLGVKGRQFLAQEGYYRPSSSLPSYGTLWHALCLTRFCVGAAAWARSTPSFTLVETRLSYEIARHPPRIKLSTNGKEETIAVIPDAFLRFVRSDGKQFPLLVEIDRASEYRLKFQHLVRSRLKLILSKEYARYFGIEAVRLAFATTGGESRVLAMQRWAQEVICQEIAEENRQGWCERFYFTAVEHATLFDPALFTDALWVRPGSEDCVPLFDSLPPNKKKESTNAEKTTEKTT